MGDRRSVALCAPERRVRRSDRPKRRTVALRASVSSDRSAQDGETANRDVAVNLTQVPKCHHDRSYIEGAEPPAYQWLGRHILPPARR